MSTLIAELRRTSEQRPEASALKAPGRTPLSFRELLEQIERVGKALASAQVSRGDAVAVVLPNGPEMATSFLGVSAYAACAPLNPAYRASELEFYFEDLRPKVLLVDPSLDSPAAELARKRSITVLEVRRDERRPAGSYELAGASAAPRALSEAGATDVALVLHTSGTTSRPKMVPLSQRNLLASADHIGRNLRLGASDCCLNIMPLFHIHGLIGALCASLRAGGSVACTPGFDPSKLIAWLGECEPTWITAVPTMYEAITAVASQRRAAFANGKLRFLRSSSASLAPQLMRTLEDACGVPVIEAYGMTEAAHQMASNPLPPAMRKPGSVGLPAGPEIAIMDPTTPRLLARGELGEIVIRGPNVTLGYLANPEANKKAFSESWFRTGDQGYFDEDGYLFLSSRLKELINRGGEKISPREIDEALLALPGVRQAVTFAMPHPTLGEDVAAAVVLNKGSNKGSNKAAVLDEREVRNRLLEKLAPFKVPARVLFVNEIPKGPTGKLQRIGLADKFKEQLRASYAAPTTERESQLCAIWSEVLGVARVGIADNFFALGGDSLRALRVSSKAAEIGLSVAVDSVFREPTIEGMAKLATPLLFSAAENERAPGRARLYGLQLVVLDAANQKPEYFTSPSEVLFELDGPVEMEALRGAVRALYAHHDAFRVCYRRDAGRIRQEFLELDESACDAAIAEVEAADFDPRFDALQRSFDLSRPPLFKFLVSSGARSKIGMIAHHLVADAFSVQILAEDVAVAYAQALAGEAIELPSVPTPWVSYLRRYEVASKTGRFDGDAPRWQDVCRASSSSQPLSVRSGSSGTARVSSFVHVPFELSDLSPRLLAYARAHQLSLTEVMLAATAAGLAHGTPARDARILMLSNGRESPLLGDLSRTIGCLVAFVPVVCDLSQCADSAAVQSTVQRAVRALPNAGLSLGATITKESPAQLPLLTTLWQCQASFNYKGTLGPRSARQIESSALSPRPSAFPVDQMMNRFWEGDQVLPACQSIQAHYELVGNVLVGDWYYAADLYERNYIDDLVGAARGMLEGLVK